MWTYKAASTFYVVCVVVNLVLYVSLSCQMYSDQILKKSVRSVTLDLTDHKTDSSTTASFVVVVVGGGGGSSGGDVGVGVAVAVAVAVGVVVVVVVCLFNLCNLF